MDLKKGCFLGSSSLFLQEDKGLSNKIKLVLNYKSKFKLTNLNSNIHSLRGNSDLELKQWFPNWGSWPTWQTGRWPFPPFSGVAKKSATTQYYNRAAARKERVLKICLGVYGSLKGPGSLRPPLQASKLLKKWGETNSSFATKAGSVPPLFLQHFEGVGRTAEGITGSREP